MEFNFVELSLTFWRESPIHVSSNGVRIHLETEDVKMMILMILLLELDKDLDLSITSISTTAHRDCSNAVTENTTYFNA